MKRHALCKWTPVIAEIFNFVDPSPYALYFWIELATYILLHHTPAVLANPNFHDTGTLHFASSPCA